MDRNTEESTIRWLGRRPMRKEGMNGIGTRDLIKENCKRQI